MLFWFFFLFDVIFKTFITIFVEMENVRLKLALVIPRGARITVANDAIEMLELVANKKK